MSKLNLNITDRAKLDIRIITEYIARDNKKAAKEMAMYLRKACRKLAKFPNMGTFRQDFTYKNYKFLPVKRNYLIVYKVEGDNLFISRVLATYQDICSMF